MKKEMLSRIALLCVISFLGFQISSAYAKSAAEEAEKKRQELRKKVEEKKKELNGGEWEVTIHSPSGKGAWDGADTLTFQDNKFYSKKAAKNDFSSTNYTLTVPEEGDRPTTWETMQTSSKGNIAFWRGEWKDEIMSGVISRQLEDNKTEDYTFASSGKKSIPPMSQKEETTEAAPSATEEAPAALATAPTVSDTSGSGLIGAPAKTDKSKKKTWFAS